MIDHSEAYAKAVVASVRRTYLRAEMLLVSPGLVYGTPVGNAEPNYSKPEQLFDLVFEGTDDFFSLELNRTLLDGSMRILPDSASDNPEQVGFVSSALSGADGRFASQWTLRLPVSGIPVLQSCTIYFSGGDHNGRPLDFTVEILNASGGVGYTAVYTDHGETMVVITGFTIEKPSGIRLTVSRWSLPYRRVRVLEMLPGLFEVWGNRKFSAFTANQQANFTNLALPYGTCMIEIDNQDRRFEPMNKDGLFRSIEERQSINTSVGVELPDGKIEYIPTGRYYQADGGWRTGNNNMTIRWDLVDIIGLLANRMFVAPSTLPTTLEGWIKAAVSTLGDVDGSAPDDSQREGGVIEVALDDVIVVQTGGGGDMPYDIGYGLEVKNNVLSAEVGAASFVEIPNTKVQEIFNKVMMEV